MLYSGIDLHKRSLVIHTLDADGTTTREAQLKSDRAAVLAYFGTLAGPHRAVVGSAIYSRRRGLICAWPTRSM